MVQFRPQAREIIAKIVYYGPPLGGKTTNLRTLYQGYPPQTRGELVVVPAGGDRTIFFDFLPVDAGTLRGMKLRVQLYTVPGQVHYNATRQIVLRGADGVVFVADSQREMMRSNRDSWDNLKDNLLLQGITLAELPHVLQYNKRDLDGVLTIDEMDALVNEYNAPFFEAIATVGVGLEETLQGVVKLVARSLRERFKMPLETATPTIVESRPAVGAVAEPVAGARIFSFAATSPVAAAPEPPSMGDVFDAPSGPPPTAAAAEEVTHKVVITPVPPLVAEGPEPEPVEEPAEELFALADPFEMTEGESAPAGDDVFELAPPIPEAPELEAALGGEASPTGEAFEVEAEVAEGHAPEVDIPPAELESAIQRVVPRALAQIGDVRELELEVPVPTAWTGGKRLTLQLRLTLVPEEDAHAG
jgi:signal recognition particle receptor subunit beta